MNRAVAKYGGGAGSDPERELLIRYGHLLDETGDGDAAGPADGPGKAVPLPAGVQCYAIAASKQAHPSGPGKRVQGDGLVPVMSALGQHKEAALTLPIPASHQAVFYGLNHFDLLSSSAVCEQMRAWLAPARRKK